MFRKTTPNRESEGLFKGIALAYTILALHLVLLAGLGLVVVFLTGLNHYMFWVFLGGMALIAFSGYLFHRRLKREGRTLGETLRSPDFQGRRLEVSLLGGLATMRLGKPDPDRLLDHQGAARKPLLEDPDAARLREIHALAELLEKELITREEFDQAKQHLFRTRQRSS